MLEGTEVVVVQIQIREMFVIYLHIKYSRTDIVKQNVKKTAMLALWGSTLGYLVLNSNAKLKCWCLGIVRQLLGWGGGLNLSFSKKGRPPCWHWQMNDLI